jgi:hypothetical protein
MRLHLYLMSGVLRSPDDAVAEAVGEIVETEIERANDKTEAVIEDAAKQIEDAQQLAQKVMEAALQSAIMENVNRELGEFRTWHAAEINRLSSEISSLTERLNSQSSPEPTIVVASPLSSDQTASPSSTPEPTEAPVLSPSESADDRPAAESAPPAKRRKRQLFGL